MDQSTAPVPSQAAVSPHPLPFARPTMACICSETDDQALHLYKHRRPMAVKKCHLRLRKTTPLAEHAVVES